MAASKAHTTTTTTISQTNVSSSTNLTTEDICYSNNFQELCRSCGKTNAELYDLFQATNSPLSTSSTTCYIHLNNSTTTSYPFVATTNKESADEGAKTSSAFDSVAATAKATAKGQSNMDNILQEMQIWQLKIKCNDGLPQRICAKCTAQFYMIHKFRRKCLKVQTQLKALYEEQKIYERQQQETTKNNRTAANDATIETTTTPASPACTAIVTLATDTASQVELKANECNDLLNDNCVGEQQAAIDNTSVFFEIKTGNTNDGSIAASSVATTLPDKVKALPQQPEAILSTPTPTSPVPALAPASATYDKTFKAQEQCTFASPKQHLKDEKKPLLKAAVLKYTRSPSLTLKQPLEQICDNDSKIQQTNVSKKPCFDEEDLLATHIIYKTSSCCASQSEENNSKVCQEKEKVDVEVKAAVKYNTSSNLFASFLTTQPKESLQLDTTQEDCKLSKANSENLFITKAALKAYTPLPLSETASSNDLNSSILPSEAKSLNDNNNNNNAHTNPSTPHCDNRLSLDICNSHTPATPTSSSSTKSYRTKVLRHRIVKYAGRSKRKTKTNYCNRSKTKFYASGMVKRTISLKRKGMPLEKKQKSWQNKRKLKRLTDAKTSSSPSVNLAREQQRIHNKKLLQMEDDKMSSISTTSYSSLSSSSPSSLLSSEMAATSSSMTSSSKATTPAVTDQIGNQVANENLKQTVCSSSISEGISSNKSCVMWKTKAAMKANANDIPMDVVVINDGDGEPSSNTRDVLLMPYTASTTNSSAELLSTQADKSSKTLDKNQSISSGSCSSSSSSSSTHNNILMEASCSTNTVMSALSQNNGVKDTVDESVTNRNHKLWPEKVEQKQINTDESQKNEQNIVDSNECKTETEEFENSKLKQEQEKIKENQQLESQQLFVLTPPAKPGSMKLIIQRKRGAIFKCRRKDEDEPNVKHTNNDKPTVPKRKRKCANLNKSQTSTEMEVNVGRYSNEEEINQETAMQGNQEQRKVPEFNSEEDENKETPISLENVHDFDSDSNISVYRDPLLIGNDIMEDDSHLTDFPKPQLSLHTECSKEMYKLYKEKINLESPKKLIVRVPLTSLTQDFKKLHLTMEQESQENNSENTEKRDEKNPEQERDQQSSLVSNQVDNNEINEIEISKQQEEQTSYHANTVEANTPSSQSDFIGFSQNTETSSSTVGSSLPSMEMVRYIQPSLCSASSKINEFINDFQNNCIDSSEIEESCDVMPTLVSHISQELSDEIRDVEDTLNGILSEMHDKDMYTPRSGETDEFFPHSVYSPLTDSPTTPSQSFYAESPCTINSNPMSVSPFIHQNMDYNAMTPQSNHSSMGHSSRTSNGGSTGPHTSVFSEHYPTYNECFEETTQSELIGFQNDIPCFQNIEISNQNCNSELPVAQGEFTEEEEVRDANVGIIEVENTVCEENVVKAPVEIVDYIDLSDYKEGSEQFVSEPGVQVQMETVTEILPNQIPYNHGSYQQLINNPNVQLQNPSSNHIIPATTNTQPQYIVTQSNQGPIIITNPQLNPAGKQIDSTFKPHRNGLQFVTLGQAMKANQQQTNHLINNNANEINWSNSINTANSFNQQPVITTTNGTTTYFINSNGELYQANIPATTIQNPPLNTILVPNNPNRTAAIDNRNNYIQQQQQQQHPQVQHQHNSGQSSQYIMLVNNLGGSPQYYATTSVPTQTPASTQPPAVLYQRAQTHNLQNSTNFQPTAANLNTNNTKSNPPQQQQQQQPLTKTTQVPISPSNEGETLSGGQTMHQKINQHLQRQIKQRQLQLLQPRSANVTQKITLVCRFCHKRPKFTNNVDYSNHIINMHPAEKPYNCPHCPMHFSRRFERQQHVAQVHGSRYQCAQCGLSFCAQRTLDFHLQKYHANLGRSHHLLQHQQQQQLQQNSTSLSAPATYQLLQHNQQQRLVRVEDVHVQVTGENKNKRSIDLTLDGSAETQSLHSMPEVEILSDTTCTQQYQQQTRKLCCPDCNGDNDDCCGLNQNLDQYSNSSSNNTPAEDIPQQQQQELYAGNEGVNNNQHQQLHPPQHVTIPSPEQTEPDSTTTLRHFRKRQLSDITTPHIASSSSMSSSISHNNNSSSRNCNNNDNLNHNSLDNVMTGDGGEDGDGGAEQIMVERSLRDTHNCLLCEESFTNEIALRKHHHLAHGATQNTTNTTATSTSLVCTICKRAFRMRNALQRHMETHDAEGRPYECTICQVRFPRPSQLTLHKLTVHKFEKPNSCEECGKQFGTETAMKAHAKEHEKAASTTTTISEASASSSLPPQLPSRIYLNTMTTAAATTTAPPPTSISTSTTIANEQNLQIQSTTSGESESTPSPTAAPSLPITNNNNYTAAVLQNTIVSGLNT